MMKNITRALALLLALVLILGLVVTGFADDGGTTAAFDGTITVTNTVEGQTYTLYKILDLESYDEAAKAYSYKPATGWDSFFKGNDISGTYVEINELGYVTWKKNADGSDVAGVDTFAKLAQKYAVDHAADVANTKKTPNTTDGTVKFENLQLGYYLLDSSLGTLCSLDTTNSEVNIQEKNKAPTNTKQVQEDSKATLEGSGWGNTNDADIGQTVNFKSTIKAQTGAQKYVFHDTMSAGLTFKTDSVVITKGTDTLIKNTDYEVKTSSSCTPACTFDIEFKQTFCDKLTKDEEIVISYSATLNDQAVIGTKPDVEGNTNKSYLSYGEKGRTTESKTTTNTWKVDVFKFHTDTANASKGLAGAIFTLKRDNETEAIKLVKVGETNTYRVAKTDETATAITDITTPDDGKFTIQGLDSDTYYLTEKEAPRGYNKLKGPIAITIDNAGNVKLGETPVANGEVQVENKTGAEMPSTGGIGTTVFYVVGGILAVGAAVLLVTKKRLERG